MKLTTAITQTNPYLQTNGIITQSLGNSSIPYVKIDIEVTNQDLSANGWSGIQFNFDMSGTSLKTDAPDASAGGLLEN